MIAVVCTPLLTVAFTHIPEVVSCSFTQLHTVAGGGVFSTVILDMVEVPQPSKRGGAVHIHLRLWSQYSHKHEGTLKTHGLSD